jgi:hypothetical protein
LSANGSGSVQTSTFNHVSRVKLSFSGPPAKDTSRLVGQQIDDVVCAGKWLGPAPDVHDNLPRMNEIQDAASVVGQHRSEVYHTGQ